MREPSLRIVRSVRPDGILTSKAGRTKRFVLLLAAAVATALLGGACQSQEVGEMRQESRTIQPENAQSVRANLMMGAGELQVVGAADALMEADFSYNVADWKPRVSYEVVGNTGELSVKQGSGGGVRLGGDARNEWNLRFNDEVPIDLRVQMGAGESDLDLDSLALPGLSLEMGAGRTTVDLTGDYAQDFDASIQGGVGEGNGAVAQRGWREGESRGRPGQDQRRGTPEAGRFVRERCLRQLRRHPGCRCPGWCRRDQPEVSLRPLRS